MGNLFMAGVATVDLFEGNQLFATAKTLLDSSITIAVSEQDVRGGQGNKLYGKYFHTSKFDAKLTDSMFRLEYLAKNIGSDINVGADIFANETVTLTSGGAGVVVGTPASFDSYGVVGWATKEGDSAWQTVTFTGKNFNFVGGNSGDTVYVKYITADSATREIVVSANIVPSTIRMVMRASLFAGDSKNMNTATKVGYAEIEVPRFVLSGNQEIAMSATGVANTPLTGSALAVDNPDPNKEAYYAMIREIILGAKWYDDVYGLAVEAAPVDLTVGGNETLRVWALHSNALPSVAPNSDLTFTSDTTAKATVDASGKVVGVATGTAYVNISITSKNTVQSSVKVTVA